MYMPDIHMTEKAKENHRRYFGTELPPLAQTDPEFAERLSNFLLDEVPAQSKLPERSRMLAILAALLGCQGLEEFKRMLPAALTALTPTEVKETVYQSAAYLGIGRTYPFLGAVNETLAARGVQLPLPPQATTTLEDRVEKGEAAQVAIFGEQMKGFADSGPEESRHINRWLSGNCFGDYYTRGGLDLRDRELITFCFLASLGGCEPQLISHAAGNMRIGNDKALLIDAISQCLPYIGYPRSLNALRCVNASVTNNE